MPPKKDTKSKLPPKKAPKAGGSGGKAKKKKWSKGKVREKLNNMVLFDKPTYDKMMKEVPGYKMITPAILSERLKIQVSLARKALQMLEEKKLIRRVMLHGALKLYTRAIKGDDE